MKKKGFTLIELLVVVAIIALLLSVIMPALKKAKYQARKLICFTNLRSLSTALHIYLNGNNDTFFDYGTGAGPLWIDQIGAALDNIDKVRFCPETNARKDEGAGGTESRWGQSTLPWRRKNLVNPARPFLGSYGLNGWMYRSTPYTGIEDKFLFKKRTAIRNPSNTPFILDASWVDGWPKSTDALSTGYRYDLGSQVGEVQMGRFVVDRHGPETNLSFVDGQVKTIPHKDLWASLWHIDYPPRYDAVLPQPVPKKK